MLAWCWSASESQCSDQPLQEVGDSSMPGAKGLRASTRSAMSTGKGKTVLVLNHCH